MNLDCADSPANALSTNPDVFLDGRGVVYESLATNLLNSNQDMGWQGIVTDTNGIRDVFESRLKPKFIRGDVDLNGSINITDGVRINSWLFLAGDRPVCMDAADADDSGTIDLTDAILIFNFVSSGTPVPACPFGLQAGTPNVDPTAADFDPTDDCLSCKQPPSYAPGHDHGDESGCCQ